MACLSKILILRFVMAGLDPAIHVLLGWQPRRGCPAQGRA
jgi:hypothetical protein